jgi:uncharacterized protein YndB with AHSA1/START domain
MAKERLSPENTLKVRRTFQAPRERVFRAWTDPKEWPCGLRPPRSTRRACRSWI